MDTVNEKTDSILNIGFKDENGNLVVPAAASYRIDDVASGEEIKGATNITPLSSSVDVAITANENRILDEALSYEERVVTLSYSYGDGKEANEEYLYRVKNLRKIS